MAQAAVCRPPACVGALRWGGAAMATAACVLHGAPSNPPAALATALPELFGAWSIARSGQVTAATSSVIGDHAVTMTVALVPLALVGLPVEDLRLFAVNLAFVGVVPALYAAFIWWGGAEKGFRRWQVAALAAVVPVWAAVVYFWAL